MLSLLTALSMRIRRLYIRCFRPQYHFQCYGTKSYYFILTSFSDDFLSIGYNTSARVASGFSEPGFLFTNISCFTINGQIILTWNHLRKRRRSKILAFTGFIGTTAVTVSGCHHLQMDPLAIFLLLLLFSSNDHLFFIPFFYSRVTPSGLPLSFFYIFKLYLCRPIYGCCVHFLFGVGTNWATQLDEWDLQTNIFAFFTKHVLTFHVRRSRISHLYFTECNKIHQPVVTTTKTDM